MDKNCFQDIPKVGNEPILQGQAQIQELGFLQALFFLQKLVAATCEVLGLLQQAGADIECVASADADLREDGRLKPNNDTTG